MSSPEHPTTSPIESQKEEQLPPLALRNLLGKGYFPKELPDCFSTRAFAAIAHSLSVGDKRQKDSKCMLFQIPQRNLGRRTLEIPNPLNQLQLSKTIVNHWPEILRFVSSSPISLSRLEPIPDSVRAIEPYHKSEHDKYLGWTLGHKIREGRIEAALSSRYLLFADIANFYTSIYTHSIPWALHTKDVAKQKRKRAMLIGNALDEDVRACRDGQTSGIPIGPDTSRILSEIIGTAIDLELSRRFKKLSGIRFYDDLYLYFDTLADLEEGYSQLQEIVQEYELKLNLSKVRKLDIKDESFDKSWVNGIRKFVFRSSRSPIAQRNDLVHYFDLVTRIAIRFPEEPIFYYAISRISTVSIKRDNIDIFINLLLRSLQLNTQGIYVVGKLLLKHQQYIQTHAKIQRLVADSVNYFVLQHTRLQNAFEVSWGLWILHSLQLSLQRQGVEAVSRFRNPVVTVLASYLQENGLLEGILNYDVWSDAIEIPNLRGSNWLLIYEASTRGWPIALSGEVIKQDAFFSQLSQIGVSFLNPKVLEEEKHIDIAQTDEERKESQY